MVQKDADGKLILSDKQIDKAVQKIIKKKKKYKTITFTMLINYKEVTVVKYRKLIDLDKLSPSSRRKVVREYLKKAFSESLIKTVDGKVVGIKSTGGAKKILFKSKQRIALYAGELVQTAQLSAYKHDDNNDKVNWLYYDSYISFGDVIYYGRINIKITGDNLSFYEINKIN